MQLYVILSLFGRKKKRRSRWEAETDKIVIPGIPTMMPAGLTKEQEEAYLCKYFTYGTPHLLIYHLLLLIS